MGAGAGVQQAGHCVSQPHLLLVRYHGAQDWLKALPVHPDLELPNELLRTTLAHHLRKTFLRVVGVPELLHTGCLCGLSDDKPLTEQHMAGCAHGGHRTERHDRVVRLVGSLAKHAGCRRVVIEPRPPEHTPRQGYIRCATIPLCYCYIIQESVYAVTPA